MPSREIDVLGNLCGSMEFFMCGSHDSMRKKQDDTIETSTEATWPESAQPEPTPRKAMVVAPFDVVGVDKDPVSVSIRKEDGKATKLELASYYEKAGVYIKSINEESKFYGTNLKNGMKLIRINGIECPQSVEETIECMTAAQEILTLTAVVVESEYGEEDFMFKEIRTDNSDIKHIDAEKVDDSDSPRRVTTDWFGGYLGKKEEVVEEKKLEDGKMERMERIQNFKATAPPSERDRIGLGFADRMLKNLGVLEQAWEDNDSVYQVSTFEQDDTTFRSGPTLDDDNYTLSTNGNTTIIDSRPIMARIVKRTKRDNLGLHFVSFKKKQGIFVYRIQEESRFLSTKLEPGMKLLSINDQPCPATVGGTLALVQSIEGDLSIRAYYPSADEINKPDSKNGDTKTAKEIPGVREVPSTIGVKSEKGAVNSNGEQEADFSLDAIEAKGEEEPANSNREQRADSNVDDVEAKGQEKAEKTNGEQGVDSTLDAVEGDEKGENDKEEEEKYVSVPTPEHAEPEDPGSLSKTIGENIE